ncbi:hypothetical protein L1887_48628 [Cichorium endivia]|nr:hypothetical protein L1887_48628 [Cichorium endivia]
MPSSLDDGARYHAVFGLVSVREYDCDASSRQTSKFSKCRGTCDESVAMNHQKLDVEVDIIQMAGRKLRTSHWWRRRRCSDGSLRLPFVARPLDAFRTFASQAPTQSALRTPCSSTDAVQLTQGGLMAKAAAVSFRVLDQLCELAYLLLRSERRLGQWLPRTLACSAPKVGAFQSVGWLALVRTWTIGGVGWLRAVLTFLI